MKRTVREIAAAVGGELCGDPDVEICAVASLREAGPGDITFIANPRYAAGGGNPGIGSACGPFMD